MYNDHCIHYVRLQFFKNTVAYKATVVSYDRKKIIIMATVYSSYAL
jgi:hypothetical protein